MQISHAAAFHRFGGPEVLEVIERPVPEAGPGEVVVKVAAAVINPTDLLMLGGRQAARMTELAPPYVAGMEFSGHVHEAGPGVDSLRAGQAVMGMVNPRRAAGGAQASFIVLPAASVVPVPEGMDMRLAAAVPMNGMTARMCLDALDLPPDSTVLVTGGAGVVASYFIPLARAAGLRVLAEGRREDAPHLMGLGSWTTVPRGQLDVLKQDVPQGVDGLVDTAILGDEAARFVRAGGAVVLLRADQPLAEAGLRVTRISVLTQAANTEALAWLARQAGLGLLRPRIAACLPLERVRQAYEVAATPGLRGRVVLEFA